MVREAEVTKPAYRVPSMAEIAAVPWNGYSAISTFSGCGGSSLGYKMAGFKVLWANEFIPAAQEVYRANHPDTILDTRDIRMVTPESLLAAIGMVPGQLDLFDGSPPCASFSTAGVREQGWGHVKQYSDTRQRTDDLFFEYARLVKGIQPKVFVAENVSGLVKGTAKGYFKEILAALRQCGYNVRAQLLDAQWLGVPQMRQRIIFVGVRSDLGLAPAFPTPLAYRYSVRDALPWIAEISGRTGPQFSRVESELDMPMNTIVIQDPAQTRYELLDQPYTTIQAGAGARTSSSWAHGTCEHPTEKRKFSIAELRRICAFPDDFILIGTYAQQWERLGRAVPPVMMEKIASTIRDEILCKIR